MDEYWKIPRVIQWTQYLLDSYAHWVTQELIARDGTSADQAKRLFSCPFAVVSHGSQDDPIFNYGNQTALDLWETNWHQFTQTPSRLSAEPINREERARMLAQAGTQGYLSDYRGIRISRSGQRFLVAHATVWNIQKPDGTLVGQAATFSKWTYL
jgi:MEKHLA domain